MTDLGFMKNICPSDGCSPLRESFLSHLGPIPISLIGFISIVCALVYHIQIVSKLCFKKLNVLSYLHASNLLVSAGLTIAGFIFFNQSCPSCLVLLALLFVILLNHLGLQFERISPLQLSPLPMAIFGLIAAPLLHLDAYLSPLHVNLHDGSEWQRTWKTSSKVIEFPGGKVSIIAFVDLQCGPCHEALEAIAGSGILSNTSFGVIHTPLPSHSHAKTLAVMYESQKGQSEGMNLFAFAQKYDGEITNSTFKGILPKPSALDLVDSHMRLTKAFGLTGTPFFWAKNGKSFSSGSTVERIIAFCRE